MISFDSLSPSSIKSSPLKYLKRVIWIEETINDYLFDLFRLIAALSSLISYALLPVKENDYYKEEVLPVLHQIGESKSLHILIWPHLQLRIEWENSDQHGGPVLFLCDNWSLLF